MSNAELIAEAREIADSIEGWLNSMPPYARNSSDCDFDRRTLTGLRAVADALEAAEQGAAQQAIECNNGRFGLLAIIAEARTLAGAIMFDHDAEPARTAILEALSQSPNDALQAHDRQVAATALTDAADGIYSLGGTTGLLLPNVRDLLRTRAAAIVPSAPEQEPGGVE